MDINKKLFEIFLENYSSYEKYEKTIEFIENIIIETKAKENVEFYLFITKILNNINNPGWQERHSEQLSMLRNMIKKMHNDYEDYLP